MISFVITMSTHALKHFLCLRLTITKMSKSKVFCFTFASKSKGTFQLLKISVWYASSFMRGTVHGPLSCLWWCKANIMATSMFLRNEAHYLFTKILNKLVHSVYCCIWKSQERQKNGRESNNCVNTHTLMHHGNTQWQHQRMSTGHDRVLWCSVASDVIWCIFTNYDQWCLKTDVTIPSCSKKLGLRPSLEPRPSSPPDLRSSGRGPCDDLSCHGNLPEWRLHELQSRFSESALLKNRSFWILPCNTKEESKCNNEIGHRQRRMTSTCLYYWMSVV